ncbi:MAG: HlyC/CorC family transporter [Candidatus Methanomethylophilaceae archaeon]|nr:HlyC/CorC family transporter [Candidatus Methanomethylophilaceae archaeon]
MLIAFSALFSMSETAFTSVSAVRLKMMAKDGDQKAERSIRILDNYNKFLTTILIGNNLVNIAATSIATVAFSILLGMSTGSVTSTVVMTISVLICGEIIPKSLARANPEKWCIRLCSLISVIETVLSPLSWMFIKMTDFINRHQDAPATITEDELEVMIDEIEDEGVLEKSESDLIKSAIRFDDIQVSETYIPRMDIVAIDASSSLDELGRVFADSGFSRIPAYDGTIDNIVGVIYAKEYFSKRFDDRISSIREIIRQILYVPESMSIATVMAEFQKSKIHMAVVLDANGGTMGIVTMEDILEELVGDIWDESDVVQHDYVKNEDGTLTVKGTANIYEIVEMLDRELDPGDYEDYSVTGYIIYKLGRAPMRGDVVVCDGFTINIKVVKGRRVMEAVFTPTALEQAESERTP